MSGCGLQEVLDTSKESLSVSDLMKKVVSERGGYRDGFRPDSLKIYYAMVKE